MSVEMPNIEDKIYSILYDLIKEDWMTDEEVDQCIAEGMKLNNLTMDKMIEQMLNGVENGYPLNEQFEIMKIIFSKDRK